MEESVLNHVVLPRFIPSNASIDQIAQDESLLMQMCEIFRKNAQWMPLKTNRMLHTFANVYQANDDAQTIYNELNSLKPGDTFAMYVRRQNAVFLCYMPENVPNPNELDETTPIVVATFPAQVSLKEVYAHPLDMEVSYPVQALTVTFSKMLRSKAFAEQLHLLDTKMPSGNNTQIYLSNWLVSTLTGVTTETTSKDDFPLITKKIRDECARNSETDLAFRRSAVYTSIKVIIQHNLIMQSGAKIGNLQYKAILMRFINSICESIIDSPTTPLATINIDLMAQLIAKMARRIEKLQDHYANLLQSGENVGQLNEIVSDTIKETKKLIEKVRVRIDDQIEQLQKNFALESTLEQLENLTLRADAQQRIPNLRKYLDTRQSVQILTQSVATLNVKPNRRHYDRKAKPKFEDLSTCSPEGLRDFEAFFLYTLPIDDPILDSKEVKNYIDAYSKRTQGIYSTGDKLGISRAFLTQLKLLAIIDRYVCIKFPILLEHHPSIDMDLFEKLLLPHRADMVVAFEVESYFTKRIDGARYPGVISSDKVEQQSFSVRFARDNPQMTRLRDRIINDATTKMNAKKVEWEKQRSYLKKHAPMPCDHRSHTYDCQYCAMRKESEIKQYEYPLPENEDEQFAVVFELLMPRKLANLRDSLYIFRTSAIEKGKRYGRIYNWTEHQQLHSHNKKNNENGEREERIIRLGHTTNKRPKMVAVTGNFETIILRNAKNCVYHADSKHFVVPMKKERMIEICTLSVEPDSSYANLQWLVNDTTHTQNEVMARQYECSTTLSLSEYKNFGSLRADGSRLQWRQLFAMIECDSLAFEQPSVLSLCLQAIWEQNEAGAYAWLRNANVDTQKTEFVGVVLTGLDQFLDRQRNNWMHPLKLILIASMATRLYELNGDVLVLDRIAQLLFKIRAIAFEWRDKIDHVFRAAVNPSPADEHNMRQNLILTMVAGCITFYIHPDHEFFHAILREEDASVWLQFIVKLNNNKVLMMGDKQPDANMTMWLNIVRDIGVNLEEKMKEIIHRNQNVAKEFIESEHAHTNKNSQFANISFTQNCPQVLVCEEIDNNQVISYITIDIIGGAFLVNGSPTDRLPSSITSHQLYQNVFGSAIFEVKKVRDKFVSVQRYNGCAYSFQQLRNKSIVIVERDANDCEMELIPPGHIEGEIPFMLRTKYTHWWDAINNCIEFRAKGFLDVDFKTNIEYKLDLAQSHLEHIQTKRHMLDVTSESHKKIVTHLKRLENDKFMHIYINADPNIDEHALTATVELVRMNLKFETRVNGECTDLVSNEFSEMKVSLAQSCGSLFGLRKGLILESVTKSADVKAVRPKIILMPHGSIIVRRNRDHVDVDIDVSAKLRTPPFHQYQMADFGRQIRSKSSSYSAWFYLAYLHAVTSHGEMEPMTGMSGTERALQILQSGFAWSSVPYDDEALPILRLIGKLSPIRTAPAANFDIIDPLDAHRATQTITWPDIVPPRSAHDSFIFIVEKLIKDSDRLNCLYHNDENNATRHTRQGTELHKRAYWRHMLLSPNTAIASTFVNNAIPATKMSRTIQVQHSDDSRKLAALYHDKTYTVRGYNKIYEWLIGGKELIGLDDFRIIDDFYNHGAYTSFADLWIVLYDAARRKHYDREKFTLILSLLAHKGESMPAILALQTVESNAQHFADLPPPAIQKYMLRHGFYDVKRITRIVRELIDTERRHDEMDIPSKRRRFDDNAITEYIESVRAFVEQSWPCRRVAALPQPNRIDFNPATAIEKVNALLSSWYDNRQLKHFMTNLMTRFTTVSPPCRIGALPDFEPYNIPLPQNMTSFRIDWNKKIESNSRRYNDVLGQAEHIWYDGQQMGRRTLDKWCKIYQEITQPDVDNHLYAAGLMARCVPGLVLPQITSATINRRLKALIGVIAMHTVEEQRRRRIALFESETNLKANHEFKPHINWLPSEYPEWLLFEIEQNVCIRPIQIEVAKRMIKPPEFGTKHSVMQLNMGEGKTSVIVPILAAYLANGQQVCQITVLKSLFATNAKELRQSLGGILNRKMYFFPCRRDMPIEKYVDKILDIYEECKREKGVILTLPEYRCSFQLKMYELVHKGKLTQAQHFLDIHKWLQANVRNILDESDAILHPKYQLIYTIGDQLAIDGGELRWIIAQAVMKRVPYHMNRLYRHEDGNEKIEYDANYLRNARIFGADHIDHRDDVFTPCRLLDPTMFEQLRSALIDDFIDGRINFPFPEMSDNTKAQMRVLLSERKINKHTLDHVLVNLTKQEQNTFMILSGLLRFEVLKYALTKRWRVHYGVNVNGPRKMAVPFKAKDVAAEMTEFGHTDVAICFTLLSYYYSGLSNHQLRETFRLLHKLPNRNDVYEQWIDSVPYQLIEPSIQTYGGINLCDPHQRDELLFPLFRFNMHVIDFWLSRTVFTREAKTFQQKLMCTAWDLCSESFEHPVTGFSGTNDTKNILPLPIRQNDLKQLEDTNDRVRDILLQPANQGYQKLPANVSAKQILTTLNKRGIPVLLDAGALMLELNNEQVARTWLAMASKDLYDAAIYFDERDILQTIDRDELRTEFDCSVFRDKLDRCLVYLDDTHTRGTDLKFPPNQRACVTISGDITRDKAVQACMRMRKLGEGQSIAFYASYEADIRIREKYFLSAEEDVTNEHVIEFIRSNSEQFELENMTHWAVAAFNYIKKLAAHQNQALAEDGLATLEALAQKCIDEEFIELTRIYGADDDVLLSKITEAKFRGLLKEYPLPENDVNGNDTFDESSQILTQRTADSRKMHKMIKDIAMRVVPVIKKQAPYERRFVHTLDDQQEKELEHEAEQEREIERPDAAKPSVPKLRKNVVKFLQNGDADLLKTDDFAPISMALVNTRLFTDYYFNGETWPKHMYVTRDFIDVIQNAEFTDDYLRPVWWIARTKIANKVILVCLSTFECNRLMDKIDNSNISSLFMYRPRLSRFHSCLLDIDGLRVKGQRNNATISIDDAAAIGMFAGGMYFATEEEQNAYCGFMGLIPRPRTAVLNAAFGNGQISANGYVDKMNRQLPHMKDLVGRCLFTRNPVDLAIGIIEARNEMMNVESHAAWILKKGTKRTIRQEGMETDQEDNVENRIKTEPMEE